MKEDEKSEKIQEYDFVKKFLHEVRKSGCYLGDLKTGEQTGMLFDKDYLDLKAGRPIIRTVTETGNFTIYLRKVRNPDDMWIKYLFKEETTGYIKDEQSLDRYSFSPGDNIEIKMRILKDKIRIKLRYIGTTT